jgi:hypothetical protein
MGMLCDPMVIALFVVRLPGLAPASASRGIIAGADEARRAAAGLLLPSASMNVFLTTKPNDSNAWSCKRCTERIQESAGDASIIAIA